MKKVFIKNRKNQDLAVVIEESENQFGLVFVMHGLGGFKEHPTVRTTADAFLSKNYTVITFDAADTLGESGGQMENATTTNYYEDLEDVINWSKTQGFYAEPFALAGHSLGGISTALYAEKYPKKVLALALIATVVSGKLSCGTYPKQMLEDWKKSGIRITESKTKPGVIKKVKWAEIEDRLKYNLLDKVENLAMPVLLAVGEDDHTCPPEHQKILYDKLPGKKELQIIKDAPHSMRESSQLDELKKVIANWLEAIR